jgi:hypothetical protein
MPDPTLDELIDDPQPCGESHCRCSCNGENHPMGCGCSYCTGHGPHVCGCDCPRDHEED